MPPKALPVGLASDAASADFDVITTCSTRWRGAAKAGEYGLAEQARLEAYAFFEFGPEQRLLVFAPQLFTPSRRPLLVRPGRPPRPRHADQQHSSPAEIAATRVALDKRAPEAEEAIGAGPKCRATVITNAAIIVFREGLEAVLILASLMASMMGAQRQLRRPLWLGVGAASSPSRSTWFVAQTLLTALARYGEKLEAVVSLIAIGVLLLILNWFFHKVYWTGHWPDLHAKKQPHARGAAASRRQCSVSCALGFTSVYREGFETVLFLQALVLETGVADVLIGVALGLAATMLVGVRGLRPRAQAALQEDADRYRRHDRLGAGRDGRHHRPRPADGRLVPITPIAGLRAALLDRALVRPLRDLGGPRRSRSPRCVFVIGSYLAAEWQRSRRRNRAFVAQSAALAGARRSRERVALSHARRSGSPLSAARAAGLGLGARRPR